MKRLLTLSIVLTAILTIQSCEKFLEVNPPYVQDAENYFQTQEDYENALTGAYDLLQSTFLSVWIGEIASDNSIAGGESVNDTEGLHQIDNMSHGGVNNELRSVFRWNYAGLTRANYILEQQFNEDAINFNGKEHVFAEAKFLRAFYYFELVKFFGGVPLIVDKRIGVEEAQNLERASSEEVYLQIENDLIAASQVLNPFPSQKGRATSGAAKALLGKVYLYQGKF
jgi:hypothetical protein